MAERVYLDWNATAPLRPQARTAIARAMDVLGNPSSVHQEGRAARGLVEAARESIAGAVGAEPKNVIFTSGGSEANALALSPGLEIHGHGGCDILIVSDIEHPSVQAGGGFPPGRIGHFAAGRDGVASLADLETGVKEAVGSGHRPMGALMAANNETGVMQPVRDAADIVHRAGGLMHVDAVQALGKIPLDIRKLGADTLAVSAHKVGGPAGIGALILGNERLHFPQGSRFGGGQERRRRGGTENVLGIAGFGVAVTEAVREIGHESQRLHALRQRLEDGLREICPDTIIFGEHADRVSNTLQFAVPGIKAQTILMALDLEGVAVSSGSACSSGTMKASAVVERMGYPRAIAECAVRVSLGWTTGEFDIDLFLQAWRKVSQPLLMRREIAA